MSVLVQKFGGSSLATADRIRNAARRIAATLDEGHQVVVVVSAMGDTTDDLLALAHELSDEPHDRELDHLLATGEQVSASLMAIALRAMGRAAVSLTAGQAGIKTNRLFTRARITDVDSARLRRELNNGHVPIVTGFQGITEDLDITTLGRGGSDTTAVALAAALGAERSEIYTDVEGVYTADPRVEPGARPMAQISYEEMLELAQLGARVMHPRAVELGEVYGVPILVRSSFGAGPGTLILQEDRVEVRRNVRGIAHDEDVGKITVLHVPDRPGIAAAIFTPLAEAGISVDTIVQNAGLDGSTDLSFTVGRSDLTRAMRIVEPVASDIGAKGLDRNDQLAKVSIVGTGMQSAPGYAAKMFETLSASGVNIEMITTSDIRITCIIAREQTAQAVRALHAAFELDQA
ncbi:MAG: aspartate kinase [Chloroflexi bacterium]|nr:aspartate kinase [Chloroflexota bacterium]